MLRWPILVLLGGFVLGPLLGLFLHFDLPLFMELLQSASFQKSIWVTLLTAVAGSGLSVCFAIGFARYFALYTWRFKRFQRLLILLPYLVPNFIIAAAYVVTWNPGTGLTKAWFPFPFGLYGVWGMIVVFAVVHIPVAFLLLEDRMKRIDPALREAAELSGASLWKVFYSVELPLLRSSLVSAFGLCFALNISAFAIPAWIGAPEKAYALTYRIYQIIQVSGAEGIPKAAAASVVLFLFTLLPLVLLFWSSRNEERYRLVSGKASRVVVARPNRKGFAIYQLSFWLSQFSFWILPLFCLALSTLVKPGCLQRSGIECLSDLSLRSYTYVLFELSETQYAFKNSFVYGALSAFLIIAISMLSLIIFSRRPKERKILDWIYAFPIATPGAVIALGLIVTLSGQYGLNLYNTVWIMVVAFIIKHLNLAYQPLQNGMSSLSYSLSEAGQLSGASSFQVWRKIVFPILKPEILGAFFLVLIPILGELTMSVFLASPSFRSIGTVLFDLQDYADQASAGALSIILIIVILSLNELARWISRGKLGF
jgi:iron(III) transport system permease protein